MTNESTFATVWRPLLDGIVGACGGAAPIVLSSLPALARRAAEAPELAPVSFIQGPPGRTIALAIGLRAALPGTPLVVVMSADGITLGTNHLIHAARRNVHMTLLLLRSDLEEAMEETPDRTGWGLPAWQRALETLPMPLEWVSALEAAYVGRAHLHRADELRATLSEAMAVRGFSVVGITGEGHLPTGVLSRNAWPEYFASYRAWAAPLRRAGEGTGHDANPIPLPASPLKGEERAGHVPRLEVRIAGLGGHGIKLAGTVLAEAAGLHEGLWATQRGEYGSATRGGPSMVDVVLGSEPITYPGADHPDVLVLLSQAAADRYARAAKPGAAVIADAHEVKAPLAGALIVPITALAREHAGKPIAAGMVALGCIAALSDAVALEAINRSIRELMPGKLVDGNLAACAAGYAATRTAWKGKVHA